MKLFSIPSGTVFLSMTLTVNIVSDDRLAMTRADPLSYMQALVN